MQAFPYDPCEEDYPIWYDGKKINEVLFCEEFLQDHPMLCVHDAFFTTEGRVTDETMLKKDILNRIKPYVTSGVAKRAANLLDALRVECSDLPEQDTRCQRHVVPERQIFGGKGLLRQPPAGLLHAGCAPAPTMADVSG